MAEFINIPDLGEARLPLNEYDKMCDRIRELEAEKLADAEITVEYGLKKEN